MSCFLQELMQDACMTHLRQTQVRQICSRLTGPSLMPGGDADAYKFIEPIVTKVAAQVHVAGAALTRL